MNISLIILVLAVIAVLVIFGVRFYEFNSGKLVISRGIRSRIEKRVTDFYKKMVHQVTGLSYKSKVFLKELPTILAHIMHYYWRRFSKKVDQFFLKIRNKK